MRLPRRASVEWVATPTPELRRSLGVGDGVPGVAVVTHSDGTVETLPADEVRLIVP